MIPAGSFMMGSPETDAQAQFREKPTHRVEISQPFYLGKYPVTQAQWRAVIGNNPSRFQGDDRPVEHVSWDDAQAFIKKLSVLESDTYYRLPTEAEWEYACRTGNTKVYSFGDDDAQLGEYAWHDGNAGEVTHPVGQKKPNAWGLYDMHGNVWEWVEDDWHGNYASAPSDGRAWINAPRDTRRVLRGGSWRFSRYLARASYRRRSEARARDDDIGFRVVCSSPPSS